MASVSTGVSLKDAKKKDVAELLSVHFGENWKNYPNLHYYKTIVDGSSSICETDPESDFDDIPENDTNII